MFHAQQYVESLERPSFIDLKGQTHIGRLLSHREMMTAYAELQQAYENIEKDPKQVGETMLGACKLMFAPEAIEALLDLPATAVEEALNDFFASHRRKAPVSVPTTLESQTAGSA